MRKTKKNAILNRIHVRAWFAAALVGGFSITAHAGYAQLSPPSGFGSVGGGFGYAVSANDAVSGRLVTQAGGLTANVGGQAVKMNVAYRFAANAPRVAAAVIFANPYVRLGVGIASWLGVAGLVWDGVNNRWTAPNTEYEQSSGYFYKLSIFDLRNIQYSTPQNACDAYIAFKNKDPLYGYELTACSYGPTTGSLSYRQFARNSGNTTGSGSDNFSREVSSCPAGWYITPGGCVQTPPPRMVTQAEMADLLNPNNQPGWPMPNTVPFELPPGTLLPVEQPVVNPSTGVNPFPQPLFVPTGNPLPNPKYDPNIPVSPSNQPFIQPGVRVVPTPTPSAPWQVDIQPVDRPVASSQPSPESQTETTAPESDVQKEETPDLCKTNPDILACQKPDLDTPEGEIPKSNKDVSLQEENLFGGGSCPADVYFTPHGLQQLKVWDWNQSCSYITGYVKPILIICCTFAAFMILIPGRTE